MISPRFAFCLVGLCATSLHAAVELGSPFSDHMVLQQGKPVPLWGWASPGEEVTATFAGQTVKAKAAADGRWSTFLDPMGASADARLLVVSAPSQPEPLVVRDVLVGEVWLCGGQSNMERELGPRGGQKPLINWEADAANARYPLIRQLYVKQTLALQPQEKVQASWSVCSPETAPKFTAVGFYFARELFLSRGVPVGIIHSSWGGTPAEAWASAEGLKPFPEFGEALAELKSLPVDDAAVQKHNEEKLEPWFLRHDPGTAQKWASPDLADQAWDKVKLPAQWEKAEHDGFDGVVWFRRTFDLPEAWQGKDLVLRLSAVDDLDTTWVNGEKVGFTLGWDHPRAYPVSAKALKKQGNVIAVRVLDTGGNGGIWREDVPFEIAPADGSGKPLVLGGEWRANFAVRFSNQLPAPSVILNNSNAPTVLFNGMIAPLVPYALRGATFYQGESNAGRADQYRRLLPAMIGDWRRLWKEGDFPFLFVQIAPHEGMPPEIREAQWLAWKTTPNTAMAVTIDCGDATDIHPANKAPVGQRLALAARALAYGETVAYSGPTFTGADFEGGRATVHFTSAPGGLVAQGGALRGFTLAGADGVFQPAEARIEGDTVVVTSPQVKNPKAVRYGWAHVADGNLYDGAGLPASPFRSDHP